MLVNTTYYQCLFVHDKKIRRGAFQLGKLLGGIRLWGLGFLGGVLFLRKKSFYVFLCPNQFLHLIPCLAAVRILPRFPPKRYRSARCIQSRIFPSMEMVTTCHGMNFPLVCSAFFAAISKPPQQGTSMRRMVTLWMSLLRRISVSFSL